MCKIAVPYRAIRDHWIVSLSQFQSISMAMHDLNFLSNGQKLYYVIDGYDFRNWIFEREFNPVNPNPYRLIIRGSWDKFFQLSDGENTCAVMSPFTIIEFLHFLSKVVDSKEISKALEDEKNIRYLIERVELGEEKFIEVPNQEHSSIQDLYELILDHKQLLNVFRKPKLFNKLESMINQKKIRLFFPPVPESAQINDLLEYDVERTEKAITYLNERRLKLGGSTRLYNSLDTFHFILIENCIRPLSNDNIVPLLTSSGINSRNSWFKLKYDFIPEMSEPVIPIDWHVRSGNVPALLLSALGFNRSSLSDTSKTLTFLEDARSLARMIMEDIYKIPEIQKTSNPILRKALIKENPLVEINSSTLTLIKRLNQKYLNPITNHKIDLSQFEDKIDEFEGQDFEDPQEFLSNYLNLKESAAKNISSNLEALDLPSLGLRDFISPMGDGAEEMLNDIQENLGVSF